jgi:glycerol-3-phosphate dehydrogenase
VLVIGAGSTGSATAHDLALRGLLVTVIERGEVAGPWAGEIAAKAGVSVPEVPTAGVVVALDCRLNNMVLNRLNKPISPA